MSKRATIALGVIALGAVGVVGALHLPGGRGLLARAGGCPVAGSHATAALVEPARHAALASQRGAADAPARPALGFELDRTTHADVMAWAAREHVACEDARDGLVQCSGVPAATLGAGAGDAVEVLSLGFDTHARLVNLSTLRSHLTEQAARATLHDVASRLEAQIGPPASGAADTSRLAEVGAASLTSLRYRYRDYFAEVVAMRAGEGSEGVVREHYMSARD
jgi:hypothetical protein